jgi:hypothetical protein
MFLSLSWRVFREQLTFKVVTHDEKKDKFIHTLAVGNKCSTGFLEHFIQSYILEGRRKIVRWNFQENCKRRIWIRNHDK